MNLKKTAIGICIILSIIIYYYVNLFVYDVFIKPVTNQFIKPERTFYIIIFVITSINTCISLYFLFNNKIKTLIHRLILMFGLLIFGLLIFEISPNIIVYIISQFTYYSLFLNLLLLLNTVTVLYLSIITMIILLVIPKYREIFKSKIIPYCILAFYSTIIYFIGVLMHAIIFFDTD